MESEKWVEKEGHIPPQSWVIMFQLNEVGGFVDRFIKGNNKYGHVLGISYHPALDCHVLLDWRNGILDVVAITQNEMDELFVWIKEVDGAALNYIARREGAETLIRFGFNYCTTAIQHALGLPSTLISTPDKLYKQLIDGGASVIISGE